MMVSASRLPERLNYVTLLHYEHEFDDEKKDGMLQRERREGEAWIETHALAAAEFALASVSPHGCMSREAIICLIRLIRLIRNGLCE